MRLTLVEALPSVLPMFSKELIQYTERTFKESRIEIMTGTMVSTSFSFCSFRVLWKAEEWESVRLMP